MAVSYSLTVSVVVRVPDTVGWKCSALLPSTDMTVAVQW
jgi:hypothetical protein